MFTIKVGTLPGEIKEVVMESPSTVKAIFETAGVDYKGKLLKLDGRVVELDTRVTGGRMLVATAQVKGN